MVRMVGDQELAEVVHRERLLLDPHLRVSPDEVHALLHPDFQEYGASGPVWKRASIVAALAAQPGVSGEPADVAAVRLSADVVLLTYRILGDETSLRSSVWVRAPGAGWLLPVPPGDAGAPVAPQAGACGADQWNQR